MPPYTLRMYPPAPSPCGGGGGGWPAYLDVHATLQCRTFHHGGASPTLRPVSKSLPRKVKPVGAVRTKSVTARTIVPQARTQCRYQNPACVSAAPPTLRVPPLPLWGRGRGWGSPAYLDVHATLQCRTFHDGGASPTLRPVSKSQNGCRVCAAGTHAVPIPKSRVRVGCAATHSAKSHSPSSQGKARRGS